MMAHFGVQGSEALPAHPEVPHSAVVSPASIALIISSSSPASGTLWRHHPLRPRHGHPAPLPGLLDPDHEGGRDCSQHVPPSSSQTVP
uniref:Uncharacterized protein n=1 Tax=Lynx canadensis TaxID=61383 RepID=A0A667GPV2_LYNCA